MAPERALRLLLPFFTSFLQFVSYFAGLRKNHWTDYRTTWWKDVFYGSGEEAVTFWCGSGSGARTWYHFNLTSHSEKTTFFKHVLDFLVNQVSSLYCVVMLQSVSSCKCLWGQEGIFSLPVRIICHTLWKFKRHHVSQCVHPAQSASVHTLSPHTIFTSVFHDQRGGSESETERENPSGSLSLSLSLCYSPSLSLSLSLSLWERKGKGGWGLGWSERCFTLWLFSYQDSRLWCAYRGKMFPQVWF